MADTVLLYDTTLRDGTQQAGVAFSLKDKIKIVEKLDDFGVHYIEGGWPGSNPKDIELFRHFKGKKLKRARLAAFGSTRRPGVKAEEDGNLEALLASGTPVATIFGKSWDFHVTEALGTTLEENLAMIRESVAYLKARGREVIYDAEHFFDGFAANPDYALRTLQGALEGGADCIVLCDTNGGSLTNELAAAVRRVREVIDLPLGIHAHNDSGLAVANSLESVRLGVRHVQGTINGYGERCGNANLCTIIPNIQLKLGLNCVDDRKLDGLVGVSRFVSELANLSHDPSYPFVGNNAFTHKGGIHVSAILKHHATYEHINPERVGNERRVSVSELSGRSNLFYKAEELGLELDRKDPRVQVLLTRVKDLEYEGFQFEAAEASFELLARRALEVHDRCFILEGFRIITEKRANGEPYSEATIKVQVGDQVVHTASEGDGPVHALDNALRKALAGFFPRLKDIRLIDYKVRVLEEKAGTAARVRVLIESADDGDSWSTIGVSTNIIEASWQALIDSIEYGLARQAGLLGHGERSSPAAGEAG